MAIGSSYTGTCPSTANDTWRVVEGDIVLGHNAREWQPDRSPEQAFSKRVAPPYSPEQGLSNSTTLELIGAVFIISDSL